MNISNIKDQADFLRGPYQLSVDITNECNYRCKHCYNSSGDNNVVDDEMNEEQFIQLFEDIGDMCPVNVCICGGEPLMKIDLISKIGKILHDKGVKNISMVSNGYFLTDEVAIRLKEAHVNRVQISLDGSNKETCENLRVHPLAYEKAVNALKILQKHNFEGTNIAFCPTNFNVDQLEEVCDLAESLGVNMVRIQPLMQIGRATDNSEDITPTKEQYVKLLNSIRYLKNKYEIMTLEWGDPLAHIYANKNNLKYVDTFANIKANGFLSPSPYLPLTVGNVKNHSFKEYWEHGLAKSWALDITQELANNLTCISSMNNTEKDLPTTWIDEDIRIDIINDAVLV